MLCDAAAIVGTKLYVLGAALATWSANEFPAEVDLALAMILETELDVGATDQLDLQVVDHQSQTLIERRMIATVNPP